MQFSEIYVPTKNTALNNILNLVSNLKLDGMIAVAVLYELLKNF